MAIWTVRLSGTAETDYDDILRWTARRFGRAQAASYGNLIVAVLARLERGPNIAAVQRRDEWESGAWDRAVKKIAGDDPVRQCRERCHVAKHHVDGQHAPQSVQAFETLHGRSLTRAR